MRGLAVAALLAAAGCATVVVPPEERNGMRVYAGRVADGLDWRLWVPKDVSTVKPLRLAIWLHPSRDSGESLVEPLAPLLGKHGYALLEPLRNDYQGWTGTEIRSLFSRTVPEAARMPGIDPQLPMIIGFSAGGQIALHLWEKEPQALGSVVLIGTIPQLLDGEEAHAITLPAREKVQGTAVISFVGANEVGAKQWGEVAPAWLAGGVPLTLRIVPSRGHEWLIDEQEQSVLAAWLEATREQ